MLVVLHHHIWCYPDPQTHEPPASQLFLSQQMILIAYNEAVMVVFIYDEATREIFMSYRYQRESAKAKGCASYKT